MTAAYEYEHTSQHGTQRPLCPPNAYTATKGAVLQQGNPAGNSQQVQTFNPGSSTARADASTACVTGYGELG